MEDGDGQALGEVGGEAGGVELFGVGGEAEQVVDDDVDGAADGEAVEVARLRVSAQMPWPAKAASPWMIMGRTLPWLRSSPSAHLLGARAADGDRVDGLEVAGVGDQVERTVLPLAVVKSPVAPMWYLTSPPPMVLRGSTSSNLEKISDGGGRRC